MRKWYYVKRRTLLLIAGCVWLVAGLNVARLGVLAFFEIDAACYLFLLMLAVFLCFGAMFFKLSKKHTKRILAYANHKPFCTFFDAKAYAVMAIMMGGGIGLRVAGAFCDTFVAFFYTGLGCALALTGIVFIANYINYPSLLVRD